MIVITCSDCTAGLDALDSALFEGIACTAPMRLREPLSSIHVEIEHKFGPYLHHLAGNLPPLLMAALDSADWRALGSEQGA